MWESLLKSVNSDVTAKDILGILLGAILGAILGGIISRYYFKKSITAPEHLGMKVLEKKIKDKYSMDFTHDPWLFVIIVFYFQFADYLRSNKTESPQGPPGLGDSYQESKKNNINFLKSIARLKDKWINESSINMSNFSNASSILYEVIEKKINTIERKFKTKTKLNVLDIIAHFKDKRIKRFLQQEPRKVFRYRWNRQSFLIALWKLPPHQSETICDRSVCEHEWVIKILWSIKEDDSVFKVFDKAVTESVRGSMSCDLKEFLKIYCH